MQDGPIRHSDGRGGPSSFGGMSPHSFSFDSMHDTQHRSPTARHFETKGHKQRSTNYYDPDLDLDDDDYEEEEEEHFFDERPEIYDSKPIRSKPTGPIAETKAPA